jgi:hypothetical protein
MVYYLFRTREFGVSDVGIHLLRSSFNYQTIHWDDITSVRIEKGREVRNWGIVFLLGMLILIPGIYLSMVICYTLMYEEISRSYKMMFLFFIPFLGANFVYNSLRTGTVLKVNYSQDKYDMFPLREIVRQKKIAEFKALIKTKLNISR